MLHLHRNLFGLFFPLLQLLYHLLHFLTTIYFISRLEETEESFIEGLKEVISYSPSHISMYSLTIEKETPFGLDLASGKYDYDYDFADKLWLKGRELLKNHNYLQYEVSNFALSDDASQTVTPSTACRHNLAYWNHKDYIGLGSGATGTRVRGHW